MEFFETFIAVITAVLIFVAGQYFLKLALAPAQGLKKEIARASNYLLRNQHKITSLHRNDELAAESKMLAANLLSCSAVVSHYSVVWRCFGIPKKADVLKASHAFNILSYELDPKNPENKDPEKCLIHIQEIGNSLGTPTTNAGA